MTLLEAYPQTLSPQHFFFLLVFLLVMLCLFVLRKVPFFSGLWRLTMIFFLVLFGTVFWNNIKSDIKDFFK